MQLAYARLRRDGSLRDHLGELCSFDEFTELVGLADQQALDARYGA
jgi:hypothetical protein